MGVIKNDVGRPTKKVIIIRNILKTIGILLFIGIFMGIGYYIKSIENDKTKNEKNNEKTIEKETNNIVEENISIEDAEKIIIDTFGEPYGYYLQSVANYGKYVQTVGENVFNDNHFKTLMAIEKTSSNKSTLSCKELFGNDAKIVNGIWGVYLNGTSTGGYCDIESPVYSYNDVNATYHKMFGNKENAVKDHIDIIFTDLYAYSNSFDVYKPISCQCGDGLNNITAVIDGKIKADEVIITIASAYVDYRGGAKLKLNDGTTVDVTEKEMEDKDIYKKYVDKMNKYQFKFKKQDDGYVFETFEKVK